MVTQRQKKTSTAESRTAGSSTVVPVAALSEKQYQQQIIDFARLNSWLVYHTFDSRHSEGGFPDIIAIRGATLLALEIKGAKAKEPPPDQVAWIGAFQQVRFVHADFVYPRHWEQVAETLQKAKR